MYLALLFSDFNITSSEASCPTSPSGTSDINVTRVQVTGLCNTIADEDLVAYFETPRSGGRKGSVIQCTIEEGGTAYVEFDSPEGEYVSKFLQ